MITAVLTMAVMWCLMYDRISAEVLIAVCISLGASFAWFGRHTHSQFFQIDVLAQVSRLNTVNAMLKFFVCLILMALCLAGNSPLSGLFMTVVSVVVIVGMGGLKMHEYIHILALPISFLMVSGLALLIGVRLEPVGVLNFQAFGFWFCVTAQTQAETAVVLARAMGCVSCLYMLSLTTPMAEIIGVLWRIRCPKVITELMYLIYRYIFILINMYHTMRSAAKSRMGFATYGISVRTTGNLYSNLLSRSYRQASRSFDAMESRCYDSEIRFLTSTKEITFPHAASSVGLMIAALCIDLLAH